MLAKRVMGKIAFVKVQDGTGSIQFVVQRDNLPEGLYQQFKQWDIGDIIGGSGVIFRTQKGELSDQAVRTALAEQVTAAVAGEIPRPDRHGNPLPSALRGPDHE